MSSSVAGITKEGNRYLLGKRKPGGSIGNKWEFPGGKVKKDEDHNSALKREFLEELEVEIKVKDFIVKKVFNSDDHNFTLFAYSIELLEKNFSYNEHVEFKWFTIDEIKNLGDSLASSDRLLINYL